MRTKRPSCLKNFKLKSMFCVVFVLTLVNILFVYNRETHPYGSLEHYWELSHVGVKKYPTATNYSRRDWQDYKFMDYEAKREGLGEQGRPVLLTDPKEIELDAELFESEGIGVFRSDKISANRSIPDTRPKECKARKYFANLPSVSVIIIFHDEWPSILLRTIHSVYNRTPHEIIKEIILVDDASTNPLLQENLDIYLRDNFDARLRIVRLKSRHGLILTRMEGAKVATGEVLVFLDSHMECNVNWLPPLLEPIVISPTTVSTPTVDHLDEETMEYIRMPGVRGVFDEVMWYQFYPLRQADTLFPDQNHQIPIMLGAVFAIRRDYFSDLGQYDEGLKIWNGEQIELSLKLHLCGGNLIEVPCSRVSHTFRNYPKHHQLNGVDVAAMNFKRVAEVWMDDYKKVMYAADPERFNVDPGDLTKAKMIKEKLQCKPFQYFLEQIAPEMYVSYYYQLHFPGYFAWGAIRSDGNPEYCIDSMGDFDNKVQLYLCHDKELKKPGWTQQFVLSFHRKLRAKDDVLSSETLFLKFGRYRDGYDHQKWKYDIDTKQLISQWKDKWCLTADTKKENTSVDNFGISNVLFFLPCNASDINQKWTWGFVNETALRNFDNIDYINNRFKGLGEIPLQWNDGGPLAEY